ncbi:MAG: hypothetical protein HY542_06530, partial [Deltaproteobacteria bacterium]|nr:hypothetical protein [Deltaproteobacteria bacterium]
ATAPLADSGPPSPNLVIGRDWSIGHFDGLIDEAILHNRALTSFDLCNSYLAFCYSADPALGITCDTSCVGD